MRSKDKKNLLYNSLLALILCLVCIVCVLSVMLFLQTLEGQDSSQETSSSQLALTGQSQSSASQESSKKEAESKPQELVKGSNHNQAASAYADKAQDVRKLRDRQDGGRQDPALVRTANSRGTCYRDSFLQS